MSFFEDASLVYIPAAIKNGKTYSIKPTDGTGDLTFTRASSATRVGPNGYIEKVRTNLLTYSQDFSDSSWNMPTSQTKTTGQTDPNGGTTAVLVQNISNGNGYIAKELTLTANVPHTASIYIKGAASGSVSIRIDDSTASPQYDINYTTSWQRFSVTKTPDQTGCNFVIGGYDTWDIGTDIYFAFAQAETGDIATDYIATTTAAVSVGPVSGTPRLDYLGSDCGRLLLEPARTNSAYPSESFSGYSGSAATIVSNQATSPDGYANADLIYPATSGSFAGKYVNISASTTGVVSCFVKQAGKRYAIVGTDNNATYTCIFDLQTASVVYQATNYTGKIENYGNGWYRISAAYTSSTAAAYPFIGVADNSSGTTTINGTDGLYIWGFQYEKDAAYATSYIPTLGTAVTRVAETYQKGGFGNTSTAGTFFYEFQAVNINSPNGQYIIGLGVGTNDTLGSSYATAANSLSIIANGPALQGRNNGYSDNIFTYTPATGSNQKIAIRYDGTNIVAFINGVKDTVYTDNAVGVKNFIRANNGEETSHATKQILFFPSALSDAQCIELTTL